MSGPHADGSGLPAATGPRSGAVRVNTGIVQTGDQARAIQGVTVSLGWPQDVPVPTPRLVQLPKPPVKTFVGREDDLRQLSALVAQGTGVVLRRRRSMAWAESARASWLCNTPTGIKTRTPSCGG